MIDTIYDRSGQPYELEFDFPNDSQLLRIIVYDKKRRIGYANCWFGDSIMDLHDVRICDDIRTAESSFIQLLRALFRLKPKTLNYRGQGIGTELLLTVLQYAREREMNEIHGQIVQLDLDRNPDLPNWYRKHGFSVSESGKISLRLR